MNQRERGAVEREVAAISQLLVGALRRQAELGGRGAPRTEFAEVAPAHGRELAAGASRVERASGADERTTKGAMGPGASRRASGAVDDVDDVSSGERAVRFRGERASASGGFSGSDAPGASSAPGGPFGDDGTRAEGAGLKPWTRTGRRRRARVLAHSTGQGHTARDAASPPGADRASPPVVARDAASPLVADRASSPEGERDGGRACRVLEPLAQLAACTRCERASTRSHCMPGMGAHRPRLLFVCDEPPAGVDEAGRWDGDSQVELFLRMTRRMGFDDAEVHLTSAHKCRLGRRASARESEACRPWFEVELGSMGPRGVVFLGSAAAAAATGGEKLHDARCGQRLTVQECPAIVVHGLPEMLATPALRRDTWEALQGFASEITADEVVS